MRRDPLAHAVLLLAAFAAPLCAQRVATQVTPDRAFLGQEVHYYVQARDAQQAQCATPTVDGLRFELQSEGITDRSTQIMSVNGRTTTRETSNYTFAFKVTAERPGRYQIPGPKVKIANESWDGERQFLVVEDPAADDRAAVELRAEPDTLVLGQEGQLVVDVYLKHLPSEANVKDPLDLYDQGASFSLFDQGTPPPVLDLPWISSPPQGLGPVDLESWVRARGGRQGFQLAGARGRFLESAQVADVGRKNLSGTNERYRRYQFSFPIRAEVAGSYQFAPATLEGNLVARSGNRLIWREAFARSQPLTLKVLEPPREGRPDSFSGAVGSFSFEMPPPTPTHVHVGDAVYVTLVVAGQGFLKGVNFDLAAQLGDRFRVERVGLTDSLAPGAPKPAGFPDRPGQWRQWDFKVYPLKADVREIPPLEFAWFDPARHDYRTAKTAAVTLTVDPASAASNDVLIAGDSGGGRRDVELVLTSALSANVTDLNLLADQTPRPSIYLGLLFALPCIYLALAWFVARSRRLRADPALLRRLRAASRFAARLREARSRRGKDALAAAHAALRGYVADRTDGDEEAMTSDELAGWLSAQGVDAELARQVKQLGDTIEAAAYGGGGDPKDLSLLIGLERITRKSARAGAAVVLALALCTASTQAQDIAAFTHAQASFEARDFASAAKAYQSMLGPDYENGYVLYDLGNAWLRAGELGRAIAAYRRASLFLPGDANLEVNLRRALDARKTPLSPPEHRAVLDYLLFWRQQLPFHSEMTLALAAGSIAFLLTLIRLLAQRGGPALKWTAALFALFAALLAGSAMLDHGRAVARDHAVVIVDGTVLRTGPGPSFDAKFEQPLGEGAETQIQDRREGWLRVLAGGQYDGWLPESAVVTW